MGETSAALVISHWIFPEHSLWQQYSLSHPDPKSESSACAPFPLPTLSMHQMLSVLSSKPHCTSLFSSYHRWNVLLQDIIVNVGDFHPQFWQITVTRVFSIMCYSFLNLKHINKRGCVCVFCLISNFEEQKSTDTEGQTIWNVVLTLCFSSVCFSSNCQPL